MSTKYHDEQQQEQQQQQHPSQNLNNSPYHHHVLNNEIDYSSSSSSLFSRSTTSSSSSSSTSFSSAHFDPSLSSLTTTTNQQQQQQPHSYTSQQHTSSTPSSHPPSSLPSTTTLPSIPSPSIIPPSNNLFSPDSERQLLLLMLLGQVCSLHDASPKTFVIHVLSLLERGILDIESVRFLFDLGLVPPEREGDVVNDGMREEEGDDKSVGRREDDDLRNSNSNASLRSLTNDVNDKHVNAITIPPTATATTTVVKRTSIKPTTPPTTTGGDRTTTTQRQSAAVAAAAAIRQRLEEIQIRQGTSKNSSSWNVEHHPITLSRYLREFDEIRRLSSGSFGSVYHSRHKIDNVDYAVKKINFSAVGFDERQIKLVVREVRCLARCDHVNVVRYYSSWFEPSWMTGGGGGGGGGSAVGRGRLMADMKRLITAGGEGGNGWRSGYNKTESITTAGEFSKSQSFSDDDDDYDDDDDCSDWSNDDDDNDHNPSSFRKRRISPLSRQRKHQHETNYFDSSSSFHYSNNNTTNEWYSSHPNTNKNLQKRPPPSSAYKYSICLFIQMQLCHPSTLADWIRHQNNPPPSSLPSTFDRTSQALHIFRQIVSGLCHIHAQEIVHRDMKPSNIFWAPDGLVKIGDFGLSKLLHAATTTTTTPDDDDASSSSSSSPHRRTTNISTTEQHHTMGIGTASYASPEQTSCRTYGPPSDIYSLGLILLELVVPLTTEHERQDCFERCRNERIVVVVDEREGGNSGRGELLSRLILECTDPDPKKRPTAKELSRRHDEGLLDIITPIKQREAEAAAEDVECLKGELKSMGREIERQKELLDEKDEIIMRLKRELSVRSEETSR